MTVQLAMRKRDTRTIARLIQWWSGSIYSHCELVIDGLCYSSSAMDGGVRRKQISLDPDKWDVIDLSWADGARIVRYFHATDHHKYGWLGLVWSQLFNLNRSQDQAQFCSQWCAAALSLPNAASYSPASLALLCEHISALPIAA